MSDYHKEVSAYSHIVAKTWADENFRSQFLSNPKQVLSQHGWAVPDGVEVEVEQGGSGRITLRLPLPPKPQGLDGSLLAPLLATPGCCTT